VAKLTPVERKAALERELARPEPPPPEPVYDPNE